MFGFLFTLAIGFIVIWSTWWYIGFPIVYTIAYAFFHRFSGAHEKPKDDDHYDVHLLRHQSHPFTRFVRFLEKLWTAYFPLDWCDKSYRQAVPCPEIASYKVKTPSLFRMCSNDKTTPLVIRGFCNETKAGQTWSPAYFKKNYGDAKVLVLAKGREKESGGDAYTSFNQRLNLKEQKLGQAITYMTSKRQESNPHYINNVTGLFKDYPSLIGDLNLNKIRDQLDEGISDDTWLKVNLFMGGCKTGSSLHCAAGGNFFYNVVGRKRWILIPPSYSRYMLATPASDFAFVISGYDMAEINDNREYISQLRSMPKYIVELNPGDVLYVPAWWWHYVENLDDFTIGCAVRDHTAYAQCWRNNWLYTLLSPYWYILNPKILWGIKHIVGHKRLRQRSMDSDKDIMKSLAGY